MFATTRHLAACRLIVAAMALLQCLLPLLHAHPASGDASPALQPLAAIHLPSQAHEWAGPGRGQPPADAVSAVDDLGRLSPGLGALGAPPSPFPIPVAPSRHEPPRDEHRVAVAALWRRLAGPARAPPPLA